MKRHICYVTGTRADFGLMRSTLEKIDQCESLELSIIVTGMHLHDKYGNTLDEIRASGLPIAGEVFVDDVSTGGGMAANIGVMLQNFVPLLQDLRPDLVLLLGDRGEMLAGALAAVHLNIFVAHIHGGERSGTIDEPVRHAISKFAHFHFTATQEAKERLVKMGEKEENVYVTGAPGLDGLTDIVSVGRDTLLNTVSFDTDVPVALMVFHPVVQESNNAGMHTRCIIEKLLDKGFQVIVLEPNSDAGREDISDVYASYRTNPSVRLYKHLSRPDFISWMARSDLMIGNSSAGIIEAASFGTPVINIGTRQNLRERNDNVTDVFSPECELDKVIDELLGKRFAFYNRYGEGVAGERIVSLLQQISLDQVVLNKANGY